MVQAASMVSSAAEVFCGHVATRGSAEHHPLLLAHDAYEKRGSDAQFEIQAPSTVHSNAVLGRHDREHTMYTVHLSAQNGQTW